MFGKVLEVRTSGFEHFTRLYNNGVYVRGFGKADNCNDYIKQKHF